MANNITYNDAKALMNAGRYTEAIPLLEALAAQNNLTAMNTLGFLHRDGKGVKLDEKLAVEWFTKAAEKGFIDSQFNLASMYESGIGVQKNLKLAFEWYKKAADHGDAQAQYNIGLCFFSGQGVEENHESAFEWLMKSANQNYLSAIHFIGLFYYKGVGVAKDQNKGIQYLQKAAGMGSEKAKKFLIDNGLGTIQQASQLTLTAAVKVYQEGRFEEAMKMFIALANQGDVQAMYNLGIMYMSGQGAPKNDKTAFDWYSKAAHSGHPDAINNVASFYWEGIGVEKNQQKALEYFISAAEKGSAPAKDFMARYEAASKGAVTPLDDAINLYNAGQFAQAKTLFEKLAGSADSIAMFYLGLMYLRGESVKEDAKTAFNWFLKAAELDLAIAQNNVGSCYQNGTGTAKNDKMAVEWFTNAARNGIPEALCNLGLCYFNGTGVEQDKYKGYGFVKASADKGFESAAEILKDLDLILDGQSVLNYIEETAKKKAKNEQIIKYVEMGLDLLSNVITGEIDKRR